jgi:hypothetical protein
MTQSLLPDPTLLAFQTAVAGKYSIDRELGRGGMGIVYLAHELHLDRLVAIKVLPPERASDPALRERFLREARLAAKLSHPNIIPIHSVAESGDFVYFVMTFVDGVTLTERVRSRGPLSVADGVRMLREVTWALAHAHSLGLVHRDVKPDNILIETSSGRALVADFGIAAVLADTEAHAAAGTPEFMSPEQASGSAIDARTDIYSLGATLYESLVGDTPFDGNTHFEIMTRHLNDPPQPPSVRGVAIPAVLEQALMRSLAKNVEDRFPSARDFRKVLEGLAREAGISHDETLRLSRDAVAQARTKSGSLGKARTPEATAATAETSMLGPKLEPTGAHGAVRRGRAWIWMAMAGVVAVAGAAVLVLTMRRGEVAGAGAAEAGTPGDAPPAASFEPADVAWAASAEFPAQDLVVRTAAPWDPSLVALAHREATTRWAAFLARRGASASPPALTVLVVPPRVFCDSRTYEDRREPANCQKAGNYYRPFEKTLLVVDDKARLPLNLASGVADATCVHDAAPGVCDAVNDFVAEVGKAEAGKN